MWVQKVLKGGFRLFCRPQQGRWDLTPSKSRVPLKTSRKKGRTSLRKLFVQTVFIWVGFFLGRVALA